MSQSNRSVPSGFLLEALCCRSWSSLRSKISDLPGRPVERCRAGRQSCRFLQRRLFENPVRGIQICHFSRKPSALSKRSDWVYLIPSVDLAIPASPAGYLSCQVLAEGESQGMGRWIQNNHRARGMAGRQSLLTPQSASLHSSTAVLKTFPCHPFRESSL